MLRSRKLNGLNRLFSKLWGKLVKFVLVVVRLFIKV